MYRVFRSFVAVALLAASGCASRPTEIVAAPPPPPEPIPVYAPPPVSPINSNLTPAATVWHVRAALNVAALACRGAAEGAIIARYNAMLTTHKATLASAQTALSAEYRARGGDWQDRYDDAMTRLYNFFSQAQARDAFCTAAANALTQAEALPAASLEAFAATTLPILDAPFAKMAMPRTVIAVAAPLPVPTAAPAVVRHMPVAPVARQTSVAAAAPVAAVAVRAPRLEVDVALLGE